MENYAVKTEGLTVAYDGTPVLSDISLELPRGMLTAIMGPNGAGKTTLLKSLLGLIPKAEGEIEFSCVRGKPPKIGYVPQSESIDRDFPATVLDVVTMGCYGRLGWIKRPSKEDREFSMHMLAKMGMEQYWDRQISHLSGGQQQRTFIARALVQKADIYFMDEPFKGVDAATERSIIGMLKELRSSGKTVVAVHHDLSTAPEYFDWVTMINTRVIANGKTEDVFTKENLSHTYHVGGAK